MALDLLLLFLFVTTVSSLRFSNTLGSHMVLQRDRPVPIWGFDTPGNIVEVTFSGRTMKATAADISGFWRVVLPEQSASMIGRTIVATSSSGEVKIEDVVFGEVILCSGKLVAAYFHILYDYQLSTPLPNRPVKHGVCGSSSKKCNC